MALIETKERHAPDGLILAMACVAQFMVVLDVSIVNVALPYIQSELHFSPTSIQWIVNAYTITFAGFLLLGGRAADLFGRRRVYLAGMSLFILASVAAGFAANESQLIGARAIQGVAAAIVSPATLTIIVTTFRGPRLPRAIGAWSAVAGGGGAVGALVGGILVTYAGWRWIFFINVPIGIFAAVVALLYLREMRSQDATAKLDIVGAVLVTGSLAGLVYAIVNGPSRGWGSTETLSWLIGSLGGLVVFVFWEMRVASHPLLPFRLFRSRSLVGADFIMFLIGCAFFSMWYFLTFYMHNVLGYDALKVGFAFLPMSVGIMAGAQISSRLVERTGVRPLIVVGTILGAIGFYWLSLIQADSTYFADVLPAALATSFAMGVLFTPLTTAATSHVSPADAGLASGVLNTSRQVGGSLGLAILATIATSTTLTFADPSSPAALTAGYQHAFMWSAVVLASSFFVSFVFPSHIGRTAHLAGHVAAPQLD
jgi:EmrB/QacA subfamily drug resistance transporter